MAPMASLTILFWNVHGKDLSVNLARLMRRHDVDLVVLAEMKDPPARVRNRLANAYAGAVSYANNAPLSGKTHLFSVHDSSFTPHRYSSSLGRLNLFEVTVPLFPRFALASVHLVSKVNFATRARTRRRRKPSGNSEGSAPSSGATPSWSSATSTSTPSTRGCAALATSTP